MIHFIYIGLSKLNLTKEQNVNKGARNVDLDFINEWSG